MFRVNSILTSFSFHKSCIEVVHIFRRFKWIFVINNDLWMV